jgi:hypothetical protein
MMTKIERTVMTQCCGRHDRPHDQALLTHWRFYMILLLGVILGFGLAIQYGIVVINGGR